MLRKITRDPLRRRLLLSAKIVFNNHASIFDCTVHALSDDGAELRMPNTLLVPPAFKLVVKPHDDVYKCEVVWRTATDIGVGFIGRAMTLPERNSASGSP